MKMFLQSLSGRLLGGGIILIAVAMVVAGLLMGAILQRFIVGQIDQRLDSTINDLTSQLTHAGDGSLKLVPRGDAPDFLRPGSGWYWQVSGKENTLRSPNLKESLEVEPSHFDWRQLFSGAASPTRGVDAGGVALHGRIRMVGLDSETVTILATSPVMAMTRPLLEGLTALLLCLIAVSALLLLGLWIQVKIGLRPLRRLQAQVGDVIQGTRIRLPDDQPVEIQPLAIELNRLIKQNAERLETTRLHAANLGHSLKTPLATLSLALAEEKPLARVVDQMERSISHHLSRTRMAVSKTHQGQDFDVADRLREIVGALEKVHADKAVVVSLHCPPSLAVACDPSDFDEMAGNLLENAFKWAGLKIDVHASTKDGLFTLKITDDGPGLSAEQITEVLQPGKRLDEKVAGHGFGLPIVAELTGLYGGSIKLTSEPSGGLSAEIIIPRS